MKKYIITVGVLLIVTGIWWYTALAAIVTVDSYSEANRDSEWSIFGAASSAVSQSFTATGVTLDSAKFYLRKSVGSPTGNATAILYAHSGTFGTNSVPTGSALATSDPFDVSTLTSSFQLATFNFTGVNRYALVNGTKYTIVISYSTGDSSNAVGVGYDESSATHAGNIAFNVGIWVASTGESAVFYVYGDDSVSGVVRSTVSDIVLFE